MVKIGPCVVTIEPHVFDATLYSVRERPPQPPPPPPGQTPQRPILQYGPPNGVVNKPLAPTNPTSQPPRPPPYQAPPPTSALQQANVPYTNSPTPQNLPQPPQGPQLVSGPAPVQQPLPGQAPTSVPNGAVVPPRPPTQAPPAPSPKPAQKSPDPVIQLLAARASVDPPLKTLMKIVALGNATPEQLRVFQRHIDELTEEQARKDAAVAAASVGRQTPAQGSPAPNTASTPASLVPRSTQGSVSAPSTNGLPTPNSVPPRQSALPTPPPTLKTETSNQSLPPPEPQALRSKGPAASTRSEISAVVFEFAIGSGDRFLFPKYSILEYQHNGTQVLASFLVVRKGSSAESGNYDPDLDYYQPVTMRLTANTAKILEPLAKVVADPAETKKYMDDIMDNVTRAEYVHLAMRLPRDPDDIEDEEEREPISRVSERADSVMSMAISTPPNGPASKRKTIKNPVSILSRLFG